MEKTGRARPFALLDAGVIVAGIVGKRTGASAIILANIRFGRMAAFTTENAIEETRRRLLSHFNRNRLKLHSTEVERELTALRRAPDFSVVPWVNASASALPSNPKDAYLVEAARRHRPRVLMTTNDHGLLELGFIGETFVTSPAFFLSGTETHEDRWS